MRNIIGQSFNRFAYDLSGLNQLKQHVASGSTESVKQVADQFESLFINMMMQSMRKAVPEGGLFSQASSQLFTAMFDQQIAQQAAGRGLGLADMITKQLTGGVSPSVNVKPQPQANNTQQNLNLAKSLFSNASSSNLPAQTLAEILYHSKNMDKNSQQTAQYTSQHTKAISQKTSSQTDEEDYVTQFVQDWLEPAKQAAKISGLPYEVIIAQAALETGWGQKQIKTADNQSSHNYFGIKATSSWQGDSTRLTTQEYLNNKMYKIQDDFRVYKSRQDGLSDYLNLLTKSPRYRGVMNAPDARTAAKELQAANYATDPQYSEKLIQIISRIEQITKNKHMTNASGFQKIAFK